MWAVSLVTVEVLSIWIACWEFLLSATRESYFQLELNQFEKWHKVWASVCSPFIVSIWQKIGNINRKRVLLRRGQNIESGAPFSIRPPEKLSWSAAEFFLQLKSLFVCVWEGKKKREREGCMKIDDTSVTALSSSCTSYNFFAYIFPL